MSTTGMLDAQVVEAPPPVESLKNVPVPGPGPELLALYVADKAAAIRLGKALFWDVNVGSDNKTACASCHFQAGADNRITNQLNPGILAGDRTFQLGKPNYTLKETDFPLTKFLFTDDAGSRIDDKNEVVSSQGVSTMNFKSLGWSGSEKCEAVSDAVGNGGFGFHADSLNTRRVEPRNTPSVINAVFNFRNFWDGRANNVFNGGDPFGARNASLFVWKVENGSVRQTSVSLPTSSLASQASGPPLSDTEMSCKSRAFASIGKKLLPSAPLNRQTIASTDSVLSGLVQQDSWNSNSTTYLDLVKAAFKPELWSSATNITLSSADRSKFRSMDLIPRSYSNNDSDEVMLAEANFSLFFSVALQLYQATLVSSDTPYDRFAEGKTAALTDQQKSGLAIFRGQGHCINCHSGAEFTNASVRNVLGQRLEKMTMGDGIEAVYDTGFYNIATRPTTDDIGVGGLDPFGNPLSETKMVQFGKGNLLGDGFDPAANPAVGPDQRVAIEGAFKTPGLRNVEFTGPYFHNGGKSTLMQVVDFYNRGGDFARENAANLHPDIKPLGLTQSQKDDLVAFLLSLSDDRVKYRKAPFDHPSICLTNGHKVKDGKLVAESWNSITAADASPLCLPAVGAAGTSVALEPFMGLSPFKR